VRGCLNTFAQAISAETFPETHASITIRLRLSSSVAKVTRTIAKSQVALEPSAIAALRAKANSFAKWWCVDYEEFS
jgi:hypothetical protein